MLGLSLSLFWLVSILSWLLFVYPLPRCLFTFLLIFSTFLLSLCLVGDCLTSGSRYLPCPLLSSFFSFSCAYIFPMYSLCLAAPSILSLAKVLTVQLFVRPVRCLKQVKKMQHNLFIIKQVKHEQV